MSEEMVHAMNEEANDMKDTGVESENTSNEKAAGESPNVVDGESSNVVDAESRGVNNDESPDVEDKSHDVDDGSGDISDDYDEEEEMHGPHWDVMVPTTKVQLRLNVESEGSSKVKLVAFNNISPKKTDEELNILCDKLASLFAYPSVGFVRINTMTYKPESLLFK
ncbi:hypothetical protein [Veillonella magna]|uniref:DUF1659 domain-containing protein n=1 Tax=Veillonella magna TaxID=464322 RepID=UPI0026DC4BE6|nr:hypothetical protein [Veillonella magna]